MYDNSQMVISAEATSEDVDCGGLLTIDIGQNYTASLADPGGGGAASTCPLQQDPILLFLHTFSLKSACIGSWHPPRKS